MEIDLKITNKGIRKTKSQIFQQKNNLSISLEDTYVYDSINKMFNRNKIYSNILNELKKLEKDKNENISKTLKEEVLNKIKKNKKEKSNIIDLDILTIFEKLPERRTYKDILILTNYLSKTKLSLYFKNLKLDEESYEKLLLICAIEMKVKKFKKNNIIYQISDLPDYIYLVISGKLNVIKLIKEDIEMSGLEYFSHLMSLKKNKEIERFNLTINENNNIFNIDINEKDMIEFYFLRNVINQILNDFEINFKEILNLCNLTIDFFELDSNKIDNLNYIKDNIKNILTKIPPLLENQISHYLFFQDNYFKKKISIYNYNITSNLQSGDFFGYYSKEKSKREETIKTKENCILLYFENKQFDYYVSKAKYSLIKKEIDFLQENYIFGKIDKKKFGRIYFNYFTLEEYKKGDILAYEFFPLKNLYFIKNGEVDLYSKKNSVQIQNLLNRLQKAINNNKNFSCYKYNNLKTNVIELKKEFEENKLTKIVSLKDKEIIGLECIYYGLNCLTSSKVSLDRTKIYKIPVNKFLDIINNEKTILSTIENIVKNRLDILYYIFFNLNNIKISLADAKENFRQQIEYEKEVIIPNEKKININKFQKLKEILLEIQKNNKNNKEKKSILPILKKNNSLKKILIRQYSHSTQNIIKKVRNKNKNNENIHLNSSNKNSISFEDNILHKIKKNILEDNKKRINIYFNNKNKANSFDLDINESNNINKNSNEFAFCTQSLPDIKKNNYNANFNNSQIINIEYTESKNSKNIKKNNNKININDSYNILTGNYNEQKSNKNKFINIKKKIEHPYFNPFIVKKLKKYSIFDHFIFNENIHKDDNDFDKHNSSSFTNYINRINIRQKVNFENIKRKARIYKSLKNEIRNALIEKENKK